MTSTAPDSFIKVSSLLTGFTERTLTFALQTADYYTEFVKMQVGPTLDDLLNLYSSLEAAGKSPGEICSEILGGNASNEIADIARALMFFWYTGQIQDMHQKVEPPKERDWVIPNGNIYAQSLSWRAIQAHASGVSNQKFGYWAEEPADLQDFL